MALEWCRRFSPRAAYINGAALSVDRGPHNKSYVARLYAERPTVMEKLAKPSE